MALPENVSLIILVVDDTECVREVLTQVLIEFGYHVVEATNGQEAVEVARRARPDLILMDLNMPVLDGFAAAGRIRETQGICDIPIIACTSNNISDYRAKALAAGFNEYITKPVDFAQLETVLNHFLKAA